jgi:hypothetical protein
MSAKAFSLDLGPWHGDGLRQIPTKSEQDRRFPKKGPECRFTAPGPSATPHPQAPPYREIAQRLHVQTPTESASW